MVAEKHSNDNINYWITPEGVLIIDQRWVWENEGKKACEEGPKCEVYGVSEFGLIHGTVKYSLHKLNLRTLLINNIWRVFEK